MPLLSEDPPAAVLCSCMPARIGEHWCESRALVTPPTRSEEASPRDGAPSVGKHLDAKQHPQKHVAGAFSVGKVVKASLPQGHATKRGVAVQGQDAEERGAAAAPSSASPWKVSSFLEEVCRPAGPMRLSCQPWSPGMGAQALGGVKPLSLARGVAKEEVVHEHVAGACCPAHSKPAG